MTEAIIGTFLCIAIVPLIVWFGTTFHKWGKEMEEDENNEANS